MKITAITTHVINMPLKLDGDVPHVGGQARTALEMLLVRVDTYAGVTGSGEGFGHRGRPNPRCFREFAAMAEYPSRPAKCRECL
jgi:hypothetical protein